MPHQLRAWAQSGAVAAVLIALSLWRSPPSSAGGWGLVLLVWAAGTAALHVLLHNRWMHDLDRRSREVVDRRWPSLGLGRPPRRGAAHATRRGSRVQWPASGTGAGGGRYDRGGRPPREEPL